MAFTYAQLCRVRLPPDPLARLNRCSLGKGRAGLHARSARPKPHLTCDRQRGAPGIRTTISGGTTCRRCASAPSRTSLLSPSYGGASAAPVSASSRAGATGFEGAGRGAALVAGRSAAPGACRCSGFACVRWDGACAGTLSLPLGVAAGDGRGCRFWMDFSSAASLQTAADGQTLSAR